MKFLFVEHPSFSKQIAEILQSDEYCGLQSHLLQFPDSGDVIPGLAGLRKIRWGAKSKGKRGGARIIYLHLPEVAIVYFFSIYTKGDVSDLTSDQKRRLATAVQQIKDFYKT